MANKTAALCEERFDYSPYDFFKSIIFSIILCIPRIVCVSWSCCNFEIVINNFFDNELLFFLHRFAFNVYTRHRLFLLTHPMRDFLK